MASSSNSHFFSPSQSHQNPTPTASTFTSLFHQSRPQRQHHSFPISLPRSDDTVPMLIDDPVEDSSQGTTTTAASATETMEQREILFVSSSSSSVVEELGSRRKTNERKEDNLEGLYCTICMDAWGSQGDHQVSCLPCGHVYGFSCINKWLQRLAVSKCPQCNAKCTSKDIRKLYTSPVTVVDEELQKKVKCLEEEIGSLKAERSDLLDIQDNLLKVQGHLLKVQDNLLKGLVKFKQNPVCVQSACISDMGSNPFGSVNGMVEHADQSGYLYGSNLGRQKLLHCKFTLEQELVVEGARLFDVDVSYQNLILARRISGMGGLHMLNKINLSNPSENDDIQLHPSTKAVKDLQISPCGKFTLLASLGKRLSILCMGSNNFVISHDLMAPAWSCSWDISSSHYFYTGLQNGMLLVFDMRHTASPLHCMFGPASRPIHTIHSLINNPALGHNAGKLLTASSLGLCVWDIGPGERPIPVPGLETEGICTSLAYGPISDDIVASFCSKSQNHNIPSNLTHSDPERSALLGKAILGSQVHVKRVAGSFYHNLGSTSAYTNDVQIAKSSIINMDNCFPMFAYGDVLTHGLVLKKLPSLTVTENLKPHLHPIRDVKYAHSGGTCVLGCASEDKLQLFSAKAL